ncbi:hypothetical protein BDY24DRAFT_384528 [Mrakia frigida]|uniref:tetratricopeptide repeat-containing protein EMW1 n=1 Tax=Mrakia frigida TaxID=29902 RepID=UPI003FCC26FF
MSALSPLLLLAAERSLLSSTWTLPESAASSSSLSPALQLAKDTTEASYVKVLSSDLAKAVLNIGIPSSEDDDSQFDIETRLVGGEGGLASKKPEGLEEEEWELVVLSVAISLLQSYVQMNWTGPNIVLSPLELLSQQQPSTSTPFGSEVTAQDVEQSSILSLSYLGEPAYHLAQNPTFLRIALALLSPSTITTFFTHLQSPSWWALRATRAHHQTLLIDSGSLPLPPTILPSAIALLSSTTTTTNTLLAHDKDLRSKLALEIGLAYYLLLGADKEAGNWFVKAARDEASLEWELTGAMGKRTKFQQDDIGQLVVVARGRERKGWVPMKSSKEVGLQGGEEADAVEEVVEEVETPVVASSTSDDDPVPQVPQSLALNDDTLLERTVFTSSASASSSTYTPHALTPSNSLLQHIDPSNPPPLHPIDQTHLLSLPLIHSHLPSDELSTSQLTPFTALVLSSPQNWSIHTTALLLRSRAESGRTRTVERSIMQLQALVDQIPLNEDGGQKGIAPARERLRYFWGLVVPSRWDLEKELAERLGTMGVLRSAMEIYERLEMWDRVVMCHQQLEQPEKALSIVRSLLSGTLTEQARVLAVSRTGPAAPSERHQVRMSVARKANLICSLGDLLPDEKLDRYKEAWEASNHTSSRAARSAAGVLFAINSFTEAIPFLEAALAINPLYSRSWFILGCAYVQTEDWKNAVRCFRRVVAVEDDDAEGWNNLASCYLRMGDVGGDNLDKESDGLLIDGLEDEEEVKEAQEAKERVPDVLTTKARIPHANKILAHRALKTGLRHGYDNWRMWSNYLLVCIDLGENSEACRALTRVVEERARKDGEDCVDSDVLDRLVSAVTKGAQPGTEEAAAEVHSPNEGKGLLYNLSRVFDDVILPRISSSSRIYRSQARLLTWEGRIPEALEAHVKAYRASVVNDELVEREVGRWREAVEETKEVAEMMMGLGPKAVEVEERKQTMLGEGEKPVWKDWKFQARSMVRSFMGRTKDAFEDQPEWDTLKEILEDLKNA